MHVWKNRAGQRGEETKVSDRFTSKDLSSCSSEPEGGEEGKTGLPDNWLDILFLTFCLQSPKWFECCLPRRCLLPLMFHADVCATKSRRVMMISACFQRDWNGFGCCFGLCLISAVAQGTPCHVLRANTFLWCLLMGEPWTRFCRKKKKKSGAFLLLIFILHLLLNQP